MLCRCIRISTQVSKVVVVPAPLRLKIVVERSSGVSWYVEGDWPLDYNVIHHSVHIQSPAESNRITTTETTLYYAMKKVSNSGSNCNLPLIVGDPV